jgi:hypothetical protein
LIAGDLAGQAQLGITGQDQPGPAVGLLGMAGARGGPAKGLLGKADGVFDGLIASDRFCWTRYGQLCLAWWRRPLRLRPDRGV